MGVHQSVVDECVSDKIMQSSGMKAGLPQPGRNLLQPAATAGAAAAGYSGSSLSRLPHLLPAAARYGVSGRPRRARRVRSMAVYRSVGRSVAPGRSCSTCHGVALVHQPGKRREGGGKAFGEIAESPPAGAL